MATYTNQSKNSAGYTNQSKNTASYTNQAIHAASYTNQGKNTASYTNQSGAGRPWQYNQSGITYNGPTDTNTGQTLYYDLEGIGAVFTNQAKH